MQVEEGNHYLMTKEELENKIATLTGGRAAEEVRFGIVSTGASNDIEQATKLARGMITRYGMSEEFDMVALETVTNQYLGGDASLACSAETQTKIDALVVALVKREHEKAVKLLNDHRSKLDELSQYLYEKETITGEEFMKILNLEKAQTGYNLSSRNLIWDTGRVGLVVSHNGVNDGDHLPAGVAHGRHIGLPFISFFLKIKL